jgi:hypothetical protein
MKQTVCDLIEEVKGFIIERGVITIGDERYWDHESAKGRTQWTPLDQNMKFVQMCLTAKIITTGNHAAREYKLVTLQSMPSNLVNLFKWLRRVVEAVSFLDVPLQSIIKDLDREIEHWTTNLEPVDAMIQLLPKEDWEVICKTVARKSKSKLDIFS